MMTFCSFLFRNLIIVALLFCSGKMLLKKTFQEEHFTRLVEDIEIQKYVKLKVDKITNFYKNHER